MGAIHEPNPVLLISAIISRHESAHQWAEEKLTAEFGPVVIQSPRFQFKETSFYESTMGTDLIKRFLAFSRLVDPAQLPDIKRRTNELEDEYVNQFENSESRPLNLDPGYITPAKLVLATTKNRDHRVYLRDGIYAEVTLHYKKGLWTLNPWTYPNYQRADFHAYFTQCRDHLRSAPN